MTERNRFIPSDEDPSIAVEVWRQRHENNEIASREKKFNPPRRYNHKIPDQPWNFIGNSLDAYDVTFRCVVGKELKQFIKDRPSEHPRYVLDLMADEKAVQEVVSDCDYDGGLAVSLGYNDVLSKNKGNQVGLVNGDLLSKKTWDQIREWLNARGTDSFDLILARPEGGIRYVTSNPDVQHFLLQQAWDLLSPLGGAMIFQIPHEMDEFIRYNKMKLRRRKIGVKQSHIYDFSSSVHAAPVMFTRTPKSADKLPSLLI